MIMMTQNCFAGKLTRLSLLFKFLLFFFFFLRETLTSRQLIDYVKEKNILIWGGNVRETEAHKGNRLGHLINMN